jgi:hypothetical protein
MKTHVGVKIQIPPISSSTQNGERNIVGRHLEKKPLGRTMHSMNTNIKWDITFMSNNGTTL